MRTIHCHAAPEKAPSNPRNSHALEKDSNLTAQTETGPKQETAHPHQTRTPMITSSSTRTGTSAQSESSSEPRERIARIEGKHELGNAHEGKLGQEQFEHKQLSRNMTTNAESRNRNIVSKMHEQLRIKNDSYVVDTSSSSKEMIRSAAFGSKR